MKTRDSCVPYFVHPAINAILFNSFMYKLLMNLLIQYFFYVISDYVQGNLL